MLDPIHETFGAEVRAFAAEHVRPRAAEIDQNERLPSEVVQKLKGAGYLGSRLKRSVGGKELDFVNYGLLHRELGRACSSTRSLLTVHDMVAASIARLGTQAAQKEWLPRLALGDAIAAFALTEPNAGSDASAISTTATPDGDEYVLVGAKRWISFAQLADVFLVLATLPEGATCGFLVPRGSIGLTVTPTDGLLGLRGSMLGELRLEACRVPSWARVGSSKLPDGVVTATALQLGRFSVAWGCVGIADACWEESSRYAEERKQFGVRLAEHQLVQKLLTDMATNRRASLLLCLDAAHALERHDPRAVEATLMAKYFASRVASGAATDAVQIQGAVGCSDRSPVARFFRDARVMEVIEGSTQIQQIMVAQHLRPRGGSEHRR
jgi:alkylation response protein AidB-like acyl-CoA dehydrogenase